MAEPTLSTRLSRRSMLAGGAAAALPAITVLPAAANIEDDARIAILAARYRRATAELVDWVEEAERRHGPFAYERRAE